MLRELCGESVLSRSLRVLLEVARIDRVAIVVSDATEQAARELIKQLDTAQRCVVIQGGAERSDSVYAGLLALKGAQIAVIHDGARCLVSEELIENSIDSAYARGSGVAMVRAKDTVKRVLGGTVIDTPDRNELYLVQTPQTFRYDLIRRAYDDAIASKAKGTDDASFVERLGEPVYVVEGAYDNIKITTEEDIAVAEAILRRGNPLRQETEETAMRIGFGEDTHKLIEGRALILGGVNIPHDKGLLGHSDADVLVHAVMDALLGAAALGDIGKHFPDTDERYKGADSIALLRHVASLLGEHGYLTVNLDATVVAQAPKLAPHITAMRENIANAIGIDVSSVSVKATTSEGLGFEGQGEGMTARCVSLITKR